MKAIISYFKEVGQELSKVTWPKKEKVIKLTLIVIIISTVLGIYVGALDFAFTKLLGLIIAS